MRIAIRMRLKSDGAERRKAIISAQCSAVCARMKEMRFIRWDPRTRSTTKLISCGKFTTMDQCKVRLLSVDGWMSSKSRPILFQQPQCGSSQISSHIAPVFIASLRTAIREPKASTVSAWLDGVRRAMASRQQSIGLRPTAGAPGGESVSWSSQNNFLL